MYKYLGSSVNPNNLSLTVKGAIISLIPLIVIILTNYNIDITSEELIEVVNAIFSALGAIMLAWGAVRKIYFTYFKK